MSVGGARPSPASRRAPRVGRQDADLVDETAVEPSPSSGHGLVGADVGPAHGGTRAVVGAAAQPLGNLVEGAPGVHPAAVRFVPFVEFEHAADRPVSVVGDQHGRVGRELEAVGVVQLAAGLDRVREVRSGVATGRS